MTKYRQPSLRAEELQPQLSPDVREFLRQIGRKGGQARSKRKIEAVRRNAKLPRRRRNLIKLA
jgi:hypothetical protein